MPSRESDQPLPWVPLGAMLLAAGLALALLLRPELISGLAMPLRLPLIALGVWALGSAFMQPLGLEVRHPGLRRLTTPPLSLAVLALFTLVVLLRIWWL
ncbi:cyd operon YbgE family protein [Halomonas sp. NO4]|uniref:cyd operon YbgE family protein n=1 Tax=Halomonas sp. NO4 TaxID=2484813 RepID=UPI0013D6E59E|nr:cyd operon YbgE family protein [Halomonas sp. NO4]